MIGPFGPASIRSTRPTWTPRSLTGSSTIKVPADGWKPAGFDPSKVKAAKLVTTDNVSAKNAVKTKQFWLVWIVLFCNVTAGIGILEQAAPMIQDFFRSGGGSSVDPAAAAGFVFFPFFGNHDDGPVAKEARQGGPELGPSLSELARCVECIGSMPVAMQMNDVGTCSSRL